MNKKPCLLRGNPSLLLVLGAGFVMASSADVRAALGMGIAVLLTLFFSSIVISAVRNIIPEKGKLPCYVLIITGFVSLICMLMEAYYPDIVKMLGVHLAALAVSAVAFRDADEVAGQNGEWHSIKTAFVTGIFFTAIMFVCALIREILGNATICGKPIEFLQNYKISFLAQVFGAYVVLAIVIAIIKKIFKTKCKEEEDK